MWSGSCAAFSSHHGNLSRSQDPRGRGTPRSPEVGERKPAGGMELRDGSEDGVFGIPQNPPPAEDGS